MEFINNEPRISVNMAAKILNVSPQYVRIGLQRERLPIGTAVRMEKNWSYHISPKLLSEYIGEDIVKNYLVLERGDKNVKEN